MAYCNAKHLRAIVQAKLVWKMWFFDVFSFLSFLSSLSFSFLFFPFLSFCSFIIKLSYYFCILLQILFSFSSFFGTFNYSGSRIMLSFGWYYQIGMNQAIWSIIVLIKFIYCDQNWIKFCYCYQFSAKISWFFEKNLLR